MAWYSDQRVYSENERGQNHRVASYQRMSHGFRPIECYSGSRADAVGLDWAGVTM